MSLVESLLDAIVRLDGDALVMHVGEKPYVVTTSASLDAFRGPLAWGQVELASRRLSVEAVVAMVERLLPPEERAALAELGAVQYELPPKGDVPGRFTVIAARGGDDIWVEIRYHRPPRPQVEFEPTPAPSAEVAPTPPAGGPEPAARFPEEPGAPAAAPVAESAPVGQPSEAPQVEAAGGAAEAVSAPVEGEPVEAVPPVEAAERAAEIEVARAAGEETLAPPVEPAAAPLEAAVEAVAVPPAAAELGAGPGPTAVAEGEPEARAEQVEQEEVYDLSSALADLSAAPAGEMYEAAAGVAAEPRPPEAAAVPRAAEAPLAPPAAAEAPVIESAVAAPQPSPPAVVGVAAPGPVSEAPAAEPARPAVIVPLVRPPGRGEAAPAVPAPRSPLDRLLRLAAARGASALYIVAESRPVLRVEGEIRVLESEEVLAGSDVAAMLMELAPEPTRDALRTGAVTEWICDLPEVGRVRCMSFRDHRGPGGIFRMLPARALSVEQLGLSQAIQGLCGESEGLVLVAGPRSSGKSTLIAAFVDLINRTRADHVITLETQIMFVHESRRSFVSQREWRERGEEMAAAARAALREDPDVLVIDDLRSPDLVSVALDAAGSGRLVFAALPAAGTTAAVERVIDQFPVERRAQVQTALAATLRAVVAQVLVRKIGGGRVAAREVLLGTRPVAALLADGQTTQLAHAIEGGRRYGMAPLNDALVAFVRDGVVDPAEAYRRTPDKEGLLAQLRREGVDTSFVERLA